MKLFRFEIKDYEKIPKHDLYEPKHLLPIKPNDGEETKLIKQLFYNYQILNLKYAISPDWMISSLLNISPDCNIIKYNSQEKEILQRNRFYAINKGNIINKI